VTIARERVKNKMGNDLFYELLQEAFSKKIISYPLGKEEAYNQGVLACKSILHDIQKRGFRNKDVVEVVRCKDCKHYCSSCELLDYPYCQLLYDCGADHIETYDMNYCSWGERRENEDD
jgi:hypothetical protein